MARKQKKKKGFRREVKIIFEAGFYAIQKTFKVALYLATSGSLAGAGLTYISDTDLKTLYNYFRDIFLQAGFGAPELNAGQFIMLAVFINLFIVFTIKFFAKYKELKQRK